MTTYLRFEFQDGTTGLPNLGAIAARDSLLDHYRLSRLSQENDIFQSEEISIFSCCPQCCVDCDKAALEACHENFVRSHHL
jgi:hypothetical protein